MIERDKVYQVQFSGEELARLYYLVKSYPVDSYGLLTVFDGLFYDGRFRSCYGKSANEFIDEVVPKKETPEQKRLKELKALQTEIEAEIKQLEEGK